MPRVDRSALVPFTPAQMFGIVSDVESYPKFLPWCAASHVVERTGDVVVARVEIAKSGIRQSFTTRNTMVVDSQIDLALVDGPFRQLQGVWRFSAVGDGCKVGLQLEFELDSRLMNLAFGKVFSIATDTMVDAFCDRAETLYGR